MVQATDDGIKGRLSDIMEKERGTMDKGEGEPGLQQQAMGQATNEGIKGRLCELVTKERGIMGKEGGEPGTYSKEAVGKEKAEERGREEGESDDLLDDGEFKEYMIKLISQQLDKPHARGMAGEQVQHDEG